MGKHRPKGICEGCGNSPRALTRIESGEWVCQTCLREIRGPRQHLVCPEAVASLRRKGFDVSDKVTREEYHRLSDSYTRSWQLKEVRAAGLEVADDVVPEELERLWHINRLQKKGVDVSPTATLAEVESIEKKQDAIRYFHARVAGVSHQNVDGSERQEIIARCRVGELLQVRHEKENHFDKNAVAVFRENGEQVGYLHADLAEEVAQRLDDGWQYIPIVKEIHDDSVADHSLGVLLLLIVAKPDVPETEVREYTNGVVAQILPTEQCVRQKMCDGTTPHEVRDETTRTCGIRHFFSKVVGVTYRNADGSDRQTIIAECQPFETLDLVHEDDNPVDANAIAVCRTNGDQLGYLSAGLAADVLARQQKGYRYGAYLAAVTGGQSGRQTVGANVLILVAEPGVSDQSAMEYIDDVIATNEDLLADLGVDSLRAVPSGEWKDTTLPRQSIAQRPVGTVVDGADVVQQSKEDDPCYGGGEQESEKPENGHQGTEALSGGLGRLSAWCWQWVTRLAGGIDGELRKAAGEGNEIIYRFLQVLLYMGVPILLVILVALRHSR